MRKINVEIQDDEETSKKEKTKGEEIERYGVYFRVSSLRLSRPGY